MPMGGRQSCIDTARAVAHVPAIQKAGMHEAARIAQALLQREAMMAVIASAGSARIAPAPNACPPPRRPRPPTMRPRSGPVVAITRAGNGPAEVTVRATRRPRTRALTTSI